MIISSLNEKTIQFWEKLSWPKLLCEELWSFLFRESNISLISPSLSRSLSIAHPLFWKGPVILYDSLFLKLQNKGLTVKISYCFPIKIRFQIYSFTNSISRDEKDLNAIGKCIPHCVRDKVRKSFVSYPNYNLLFCSFLTEFFWILKKVLLTDRRQLI